MDIKQVQNLAKLARIELTEQEQEALLKDMSNILTFVGQLQEVTLPGGLTPTVGVPHNVMRDDNNPHESGIYTDAILNNAPATKDGYIRVKNIL